MADSLTEHQITNEIDNVTRCDNAIAIADRTISNSSVAIGNSITSDNNNGMYDNDMNSDMTLSANESMTINEGGGAGAASTTPSNTSTINDIAGVNDNDNGHNNINAVICSSVSVPSSLHHQQRATSTTIRLPNGQIMDAKNTLQSFSATSPNENGVSTDRKVATGTTVTSHDTKKINHIIAKDLPLPRMEPPLAAVLVEPVLESSPSNIDIPMVQVIDLNGTTAQAYNNHNHFVTATQQQQNQQTNIINQQNDFYTGNGTINITNSNRRAGNIHAIPVHSMEVVEAETFDPVLFLQNAQSSTPQPQPLTPPPLPSKQRTTVWCRIILLCMTIGISLAIGIIGYCASGQCSSSASLPEPTNIGIDITNTPTFTAPAMANTTMIDEYTTVCTFIGYTTSTGIDWESCLSTTNVMITGEYATAIGDNIPNEIGLLTKLTALNLRNDMLVVGLNSTIPSSIGNLVNLEYLDLYNNELTGTIPSSIGKLTKLTYLDIHNNDLTGYIPSSVINLVQLNHLHCGYNYVTGTIPSLIGNLVNLEYININGNRLNGTIPSSLGEFNQLTYLSFNGNRLTGSIPSSLESLVNLKWIDLQSNMFNGTIPLFLENMVELTHLDLSYNGLIGTIPSFLFANLINLTYLSLSDNYVTNDSTGDFLSSLGGTIPTLLGNLVELTHLALGDNTLIGTIPSSFGNLTELVSLELVLNKLTGTIPSSLGNLLYLTYLDLRINDLSGTIPSSFANLMSLEALYLNENAQLIGTIPSILCTLPKLAGNIFVDCNNVVCSCCVSGDEFGIPCS